VGERRPAHEGGVIAGPPEGLANAVAEQDHLVGGGHGVRGIEHGLDLAGAKFNLQGLQGKPHGLRGSHHDVQRLVAMSIMASDWRL